MTKENKKNLFLILYILIVVFLISWFFYARLKNNIIGSINTLISTTDIWVDTWYVGTGIDLLTWIDVELSDIDKVYGILETWKPWEDFSVISPKPQTMRYSTTVEDDFKQYLANNIYTVTMPKDIKWWYLYIKLRKPLKYMPNIGVYQPITLKTNIYVDNRWVYWRLDTTKSLWIYKDNQEFLYKLSDVPVRTTKHNHTSWLDMAWKQIQIWWFVSDTNGNYIENIIFIWER